MAAREVTIRFHVAGLELVSGHLAGLVFELVILRLMHGWAPRELEARAYPGQPSHTSTPAVRPCTCAYHVAITPADGHLVVPAYPSTAAYLEEEHDEGNWTHAVWYPRCPVLSWFTIRRSCPHHGHTAYP